MLSPPVGEFLPKIKSDTITCDEMLPETHHCRFCDFRSGLKVIFTEHFRLTHEDKEANDELDRILECYGCENCDFKTYSVLLLVSHVSKHCESDLKFCISEKYAKSTGNWFQCSHCLYGTKFKGNLKKHALLKHSKEDIFFKCSYCNYIDIMESGLNRHILRAHQETDSSKDKSKKKKPWKKCEHCIYKTRNNIDYKSHVARKHTNPEDVDWLRCEHCEYKTVNKHNLKEHISRHRTSEHAIWFNCEYCIYKTTHKYDLKKHLSRIHANPEDYWKCAECSYKTRSKYNLNRHMSQHNKNDYRERFNCVYCAYSSVEKSNLERHMMRKHNGNHNYKKFKCGYCLFKSATKFNVKRHISRQHKKINIAEGKCRLIII